MSRIPDPAPAPFIVGVPRSGTTLLRLQLDAHPELAIPAETGFGAVATRFAGSPPTREDFLTAVAELPTWADLGVGRDELASALEAVPEWSLSAGFRAYYRAYAAKHGKARYGDKTPDHASNMDTLARVLPEARFIHIIRDGRGVAASLRGLPFAPGDGGIRAIATDWRDTIWSARRMAARLSHYTEVRYERLVSEPEPVLRELCAFLDLPFEPSMLTAHERALDRLAELRSAAVQAHGVVRLGDGTEVGVRTSRPPDPSRAGRWRNELSEYDVAQFERLAGGSLALDGYEPYEHPAKAALDRGPRAARTSAMRVVLGRQIFTWPGGTETYALTVARELERLGHDVVITGEELGAMADYARARGVRVEAVDALEGECDAVLAHDLPMAALLATRFPNARLVFVAHSDAYDHQLPPLIPGIVDAVVACSDRMAARARAVPLDVPIVRLREPIDTDDFVFPRKRPARPRRALLLSNYLRGERRQVLVDAWEAAGVECVQVGGPTEVALDPRPAMQGADIVVAKARAALEAMSAGCAVYVYDQYGGDGWVTPENYPAFEADHFAGQATPRPRTRADLEADLGSYTPDMGVWNNELVRTHHGARHHAIELVAVLRGSYPRKPERVEALAEFARIVRGNGRSELRVGEFCNRMNAAEALAAEERERAAEERERAAKAEQCAAEAEARAAAAERRFGDADYLLRTKRVQAGLTIGRAVDRLRSRS